MCEQGIGSGVVLNAQLMLPLGVTLASSTERLIWVFEGAAGIFYNQSKFRLLVVVLVVSSVSSEALLGRKSLDLEMKISNLYFSFFKKNIENFKGAKLPQRFQCHVVCE